MTEESQPETEPSESDASEFPSEEPEMSAPEVPDEPSAQVEAPDGPASPAPRWKRAIPPLVIFLVTASVYVLVAGPRTDAPSPNNHYVHLAESWLNGQLDVVGGEPHGYNDWACFDETLEGPCDANAFQRPRDSYRWYISFPPFPAAVLLPVVAVFGQDFSDPFFWALFAGLAPALLWLVLRRLREEKISPRSPREDLLLVTVFAFGSVYFSTAVQGSVWFSAHIVASALLMLFFLFGIGAKRPFWAGVALGLCFWTRPSTSLFALFFLLEAMRVNRRPNARAADPEAGVWRRLGRWILGADPVATIKACLPFAAPILVVGGVAMWMNHARFADPFEFGHTYLIIRWRPRIEKWGLFNFHYFSKNLAVFVASLPWLSAATPWVKISRHGLALWFTSPNLLPALWPKRVTPMMVSLFVVTAMIAVWDLCYQNSGWVQFGYRFSLDYMPALIVLLALSRRRFGVGFGLLLAFAIAVNLFGAITFDRAAMFYDDDNSQERLFQPD
ncbi:MAG: hypothetical protein AB8I08_26895 [Sandaracinaceae bacterium]